MVEKDLPIKKELMKISDAMNLFKEKGMTDKTSLFKYRRSSFVNSGTSRGAFLTGSCNTIPSSYRNMSNTPSMPVEDAIYP